MKQGLASGHLIFTAPLGLRPTIFSLYHKLMPELPEAEFAARQIRHAVGGKQLIHLRAHIPRMVRKESLPLEQASGKKLTAVNRVGKHLFLELEKNHSLWLHLGMSGRILTRMMGEPVHRHSRVEIGFGADACLEILVDLNDPRTLGGIALLDRDGRALFRGRLGVDALNIDSGATLKRALGNTARAIKVALLDQKRIAGIGNIQACDALFLAGIRPGYPANKLSRARLDKLAKAIGDSLERTLATLPDPAGPIAYMTDGAHVENPFLVYGREGQPCSKCERPIRRTVLGGRGTFSCTRCQR